MVQRSGFSHAAAVTPNDSNKLAPGFTAKALYIGGAGDVVVVTSLGDTVTFKAVPVGTVLPVQVNIVKATNTTATNILVLGD